jgi:hypothetical protein
MMEYWKNGIMGYKETKRAIRPAVVKQIKHE